jgi:2-keto-3-deoxy-L-fuconate dehydrogenase
MKLAGKVAIITGAGAGIGKASCELFAGEGARLVLIDRDATAIAALADQLRQNGASCLPIAADVSKQSDVESAVGEALRHFSAVDILFNNAGIVAGGLVHEMSLAEWEETFRVNVTSMFLFCHAVLPHFLERHGGVILNTSSATALRTVPSRAAYTASKSAVLGLSKSMALDYAAYGIRVNCLCPGTIDTPSLRERVRAQGDFDTAWSAFVSRQPLKRLGHAEEVARAALYLVSDEAAFITGAAFQIDGGMSL